MALSVSMTGTGSVGDIEAGWSYNESATPVAIGDAAVGTGTVTFNAKAKDDSLLIINNTVTSTINDLGTTTGVVQSVSETGSRVTVTHNTSFEKFNMDVTVPPVASGGVRAWFYGLYEAMGLQERPTYLPGNAQNGVCFPFDSNPLSDGGVYSIDDYFTVSTRSPIAGTAQGYAYSNVDPFPTGWIGTGNDAVTPSPIFPNFYANRTTRDTLIMQFPAMVDSGTRIFFGNKLGAGDGGGFFANFFSFDIDGSANTVKTYEYFTETNATVSIAALDKTQPILFTLYLKYNVGGNAYGIFAKATDHTGTTVTTAEIGPVYGNNGEGWGIVTDYINTDSIGAVNFFTLPNTTTVTPVWFEPGVSGEYYDIDFSDYTGTYDGAYPAVKGVGWELIQQLCAAMSCEMALVNDTLTIRDIGSLTYDMTNVAASPTLAPNTAFSGASINVNYSDAEFIDGVIYNAELDGNNIISVNAGETTITSVKYGVSPISINQPTLTTTFPLPDGTYYVIDAEGLPLSAAEWTEYGASVTATIDPDDPNAIQITVVGPYTDVTLAGGPYKLAVSDSEVEYGGLKIAGTGVNSIGGTIAIGTGVDPTKFSRKTVTTIDNPFVVDAEAAYDRGVWAGMKAGGPTVTLTATVPVSSLSGLGLTCGALIQYRNSTYRINNVGITAISANITAERYVTVADMDAIWGSQTVADYDGFWGAYECQDQIVYPYLGV